MMSSIVRAWISRRVPRIPGLSIWKQPMVRASSTVLEVGGIIQWDAGKNFQPVSVLTQTPGLDSVGYFAQDGQAANP